MVSPPPQRQYAPRRSPRHRRRARDAQRRGMASVLAMLFLILFSALALGFFASATMSAQVSRNERRGFEAQLAAESGLQFMRYQLARLTVPPGTADAQMPAEIQADLVALLQGTLNLGDAQVTRSGATVSVPTIALENDRSFSATVYWSTPTARLTVTGTSGAGPGAVTRSLSTDFNLQSRTGSILGYGIASKGPVTVKSSAATKVLGTPDLAGSILSAHTGATAITTGNGTIDGDLAVTVAKSQVSLGGGSVGGSTGAGDVLANHVSVVPTPEFPVVKTDAFAALAVNAYDSKKGHQKNVRVPPNTNPRFNGGDVIDGVLYIESPNRVTFRGHAQVNGVIVFQGTGNPGVNSLDFRGNVQPGSIPAGAEFDAVRAAAQGLAIVAPTASVTMSGSTDGYLDGSLIAYSLDLGGSADLWFSKGSIVTVGPDATKVQGKTVNFTGTGADNPPKTGLTFSGSLRPDPGTYRELP